MIYCTGGVPVGGTSVGDGVGGGVSEDGKSESEESDVSSVCSLANAMLELVATAKNKGDIREGIRVAREWLGSDDSDEASEGS